MRTLLPLLSLLALSACATASLGPGIGGRELIAQDVNGVPVAGPKPLTLRFEGGRASGSAGCNSFSGSYQASEGRLEFGPLATTRMACTPDIMEQEQRFLAILAATRSISRYGNGSVSLIAPDGRAVRFRPAS
jgi:heat shock protein HslJ